MQHKTGYCNPEPAIKKVFDYKTNVWTEQEVQVQLNPEPFQEGTLRYIFYLRDFTLPPGEQEVCAKLSKDPNDARDTYYMDVKMQCKAKDFATKFNQKQPPKKIDFVIPWVLEFKRRPARNGIGRLVMNIEPLLVGKYIKHSNNFGFVSKEDRNTPAAFSHWTYHASNSSMLVCDIQGVEDMYTDPQIHSTHMLFGKADLGHEGIRKFFGTHQCNAICQFLQLPQVSGAAKPVSFQQVITAHRGVPGGVPAAVPTGPIVPGIQDKDPHHHQQGDKIYIVSDSGAVGGALPAYNLGVNNNVAYVPSGFQSAGVGVQIF